MLPRGKVDRSNIDIDSQSPRPGWVNRQTPSRFGLVSLRTRLPIGISVRLPWKYMGKIIVTGAGGYIGSTLCDVLLQEGHKVVGVDRYFFGTHFLKDIFANP